MPRERKLPPGMWLRGRVYWARFRSEGELIRKPLSPDFRVACEMLTDLRLGAYRRGKGEVSNDLSIESLTQDWFRSIGQTLEPSTVKRYRQSIAHVERLLPVRHVAQLDLDVVERFRQDRLCEDVEPQTVNKDVGALRTMLNWAVERKRIAGQPKGVSARPRLPERRSHISAGCQSRHSRTCQRPSLLPADPPGRHRGVQPGAVQLPVVRWRPRRVDDPGDQRRHEHHCHRQRARRV